MATYNISPSISFDATLNLFTPDGYASLGYSPSTISTRWLASPSKSFSTISDEGGGGEEPGSSRPSSGLVYPIISS